jgi:membrane fusion protein (multidrug efflux system)
VDQTVQLESDAFPGVVFPARVTAIDAAVDASGRSLLLRAELRDGSKRLKPGMFVRVRLVLETRTNAVIIPEEALVTSQGKVSVFKVTDGVAVITPVRVGLRTQVDQKAVVEILEGLAKDERVVTAGQIKIRGSQMPVKSVDARAGAATGAAGGPTAVPASAAGAPTTMNKKAP